MLTKHLAACLAATALAAMPALAQTSNPASSGATDRPVASGSGSATTGSPAMQPNAPATQPGSAGGSAMSAPATGSSSSSTMGSSSPATGSSTLGTASGGTMGAGGASGQSTMARTGGQGQFMTQMQPTQVMASKLIGTTVVGANNESIGDVNDVILDRTGQAMAVVIGVGGFLGIGEKDVAVPFSELEFGSAAMTAGASGGTMTGSGQSTQAGGNNVSATGSTGSSAASNRSTATTGNTGSGDPNTNASTAMNGSGAPERIVLRMTKDELQGAPSFRSGSNQNAGGSGGGNAPTAPRQ